MSKTSNVAFCGMIITIINCITGSTQTDHDPYLVGGILASVENISISKLLDFSKIAVAIEKEFDRSRFYYIIAYEIDQRVKKLDNKFIASEKKYVETIIKYENELALQHYQYLNNRPNFDYVYHTAEISDETIANDIHLMQAELSRNQFIQVYKYYRRRIDNYKNYLSILRELYKCKIIENKENKVEYYSNFPEMYQGVKLFHDSMDDAGNMHVNRNILGKVLYIDWNVEGEKENSRRREFKYYNDGLLSKLIDKINNEIVFETWFGENDLAENFLNYIFSPGFIPHDYSYYTEVYFNNGRPNAYKFSTMDEHVIGTIYREFDDNDHLVKEVWCKGETSKILREFTSIFDSATGNYKLIERDKNGTIVHQEIVLSSND